ncbi:tryptophan synthase subunit beta [Pararhodobacter zhoushanensis]|uniref:Tryptophan synthase subunit beta n=1 Tax=Pararhodobacter zhoushanensis TaxID=2479545 RepID=A0ABT3GWY6_9RHOB|nr:tryptophan synthase subunit beta [Pararhodobacter zhoushanensis]MCW1932060.1 tryptophan synthase subunit beta [Pararhodobacter zhoushanensis]
MSTPTDRRFRRQIAQIERRYPRIGGALQRLTAPGRLWMRLPAAILLILGGFLGFLPVLGVWMLPVGLLLLAVDLPLLRPAVGGLMVRLRSRFRRWLR